MLKQSSVPRCPLWFTALCSPDIASVTKVQTSAPLEKMGEVGFLIYRYT